MQPREIIAARQARVARTDAGTVRIAAVVAIMLRKLQAERVSPTSNRAVLFDEGEARECLLSSAQGRS